MTAEDCRIDDRSAEVAGKTQQGHETYHAVGKNYPKRNGINKANDGCRENCSAADKSRAGQSRVPTHGGAVEGKGRVPKRTVSARVAYCTVKLTVVVCCRLVLVVPVTVRL